MSGVKPALAAPDTKAPLVRPVERNGKPLFDLKKAKSAMEDQSKGWKG